MKTISILGKQVNIKDYHCCGCGSSFDSCGEGVYELKGDDRLWLYVCVTDICNAACRFCVNSGKKLTDSTADPENFRRVLRRIKNNVRGVSITGGEPTLYPELLDNLIGIVSEVMDDEVEIDIVSNGSNLEAIAQLRNLLLLTSIHISRHAVDDKANRELMHCNEIASIEELKYFVDGLDDKGAVVLNCVLQKGGIENGLGIAEYLDMAINLEIKNTGFFTLMQANDYCREHYLSSYVFPFVKDFDYAGWNNTHDSQFKVWNRFRDYDYCKCINGTYTNKDGITRFYFRFPENVLQPEYCRQLVYTSNNILQCGFGKNQIILC